ncbi:Glycosyltransferase family 4 protein [Gammaproteobacteria bacterium]
MKIAIIHDWLSVYAGAERILEQLLICYPDADLFSVVDFFDNGLRKKHFLNKKATTSFIQKLPFARKKYYLYLPLMPLAIEQFDLTSYDLIISVSHAVAKGVITGPDQLHISYICSPMRYIWDLQHQYLREANIGRGVRSWIMRSIFHKIRLWDLRTVNSVDHFASISYFIDRRIQKFYHRDSTVIYPPVDVDAFSLAANKEDFYLTASRMMPYKKIDIIVEAFSKFPDKKLVVIGDGYAMGKIRKLAKKNVELMGFQPFPVLRNYMQKAKAFIFAAEEDFGIAPLEAQACGTPVIAYGRGGTLETIRDLDSEKPTGMFFHEQSVESLCNAIVSFEENAKLFKPENCRSNALRFAPDNFRKQFKKLIEMQWQQHKEKNNLWNRQQKT